MTTLAQPSRTTTAPRPARPRRLRRWLGENALRIYAGLALAYVFLPIAYVTVFSFNVPGRTNLTWRGFTTTNWAHPCDAPDVCAAVGNSLRIGLVSTLIATVLGTLMAFALARHRFRGRATTNVLLFLPMATPEVVLAASLLTLFLNLRLPLGYWTIVAAHVMFCISFVVVTVKARVASLDPRLEQAARDLYAGEFETFRRITLPLVAPGIAGAALLAFSLSFDDFIITNFVSGEVTTFPKFVYVSAQRGIPAQAYVIGAAAFFVSLAVVLGGEALRRRGPGR
ncbi:MAG TPA: ABC transporter permease [Actinomycetales bacterium]|nr:ABC transporter permease [Actinomycetales bacterium]